MTYAFLGLAIAQLGALVTVAVWYRNANKRADAIRDLLDEERKVRSEVEHQRDVATTRAAVADKQLSIEKNLRQITEAQRNEAQRKARDLLRQHVRTATDDEIREMVDQLFVAPLSLVPVRVQPQVSPRSESGPDALVDPFA